MSTARESKELQAKAKDTLKTSTVPMERLRAACLLRGAQGIKGLGRLFKIMDDNHNHQLCFEEFKKAIYEYDLGFTKEQIGELFHEFDTDKSGLIDYQEFIVRLRPPLSSYRSGLINQAFTKLDKDHDGQITLADLRGVYRADKHPKYLNGQWSEDDVLKNYLEKFEYREHKDGIVTREEFLDYYAGVSASIDTDAYFGLMMKNAWRL